MKKVRDITQTPKRRSLKSRIVKTSLVGIAAVVGVVAVSNKLKDRPYGN